jgi:hypothetical protein
VGRGAGGRNDPNNVRIVNKWIIKKKKKSGVGLGNKNIKIQSWPTCTSNFCLHAPSDRVPFLVMQQSLCREAPNILLS